MVAPKVSDVRSCLIDIRARGGVLALEFDDDHARAYEKDRVWAPRFERQFVFQNRGVLACCAIPCEELPDLSLEIRNRIVPGTDLLGARISNKTFEVSPNHASFRLLKGRQIRFPATTVQGHVSLCGHRLILFR